MRLAPAAEAAGFRLVFRETLDSTNSAALGAARDGQGGPLWIAARRQTAGRGRRGRVWESPAGNLHATLLLAEAASTARNAPQLSFVAALAVHDAIAACAPRLRTPLALKWPNDVLCGGRKIAGILIEGETIRDGRLAVAIGIGVNCIHHPAQAAFPAGDLVAAGADLSADDVLFALSAAMLPRLDQWAHGEGFSSIRADWLDRAGGLGGPLRVRVPDREFSGTFEALDESGCLVVRLADGSLQIVAAGDVFPIVADAPASRVAEVS